MDLLLTAMSLALADVDAELRTAYPDLFVRVDEILAAPGRHGPNYELSAVRGVDRPRECAWCGEWFITDRASRPAKSCSPPCSGAYRAWRKRRAA
jgi:hypothetical protein